MFKIFTVASLLRHGAIDTATVFDCSDTDFGSFTIRNDDGHAYGDLPLEPQIDEPVPDEVLARLMRIPYFAEAYAEDGIAPQDFASHPALEATGASFSEAMVEVEGFAAKSVRAVVE